MPHALVFVLAQPADLPAEGADLAALEASHRRGIGSGVALRIFRSPSGWTGDLESLVSQGGADSSGRDPFQASDATPASPAPGSERRRMLCDALVPHFEPRSQWLAVYELSAEACEEPTGDSARHPIRAAGIHTIRCLDRFPLREAPNETCWFYPTDDGAYLSWENRRRITTLPGFLPERPWQEESSDYDRSGVHVLWSLMADDLSLTCVGFTYRGRRIEWPLLSSDPEPFATWTAFQVDSTGENSFRETASITVFED